MIQGEGPTGVVKPVSAGPVWPGAPDVTGPGIRPVPIPPEAVPVTEYGPAGLQDDHNSARVAYVGARDPLESYQNTGT